MLHIFFDKSCVVEFGSKRSMVCPLTCPEIFSSRCYFIRYLFVYFFPRLLNRSLYFPRLHSSFAVVTDLCSNLGTRGRRWSNEASQENESGLGEAGFGIERLRNRGKEEIRKQASKT